MKNLISIILSIILIAGTTSIFTVSVSADSETPIKSKFITEPAFPITSLKEGIASNTQEFWDAFNYYFNDETKAYASGIYPPYDAKRIDYNIETLENSPIYFYYETNDIVVFGIETGMDGVSEVIGGYIIDNSAYFCNDNLSGYCLYKDGKVYGVANAVSKGLIEVETLAEIIPEMHKKDVQPTETETQTETTETITEAAFPITSLKEGIASNTQEFWDAFNYYFNDETKAYASGIYPPYDAKRIDYNIETLENSPIYFYYETNDIVVFGIETGMDGVSEVIGGYIIDNSAYFCNDNLSGYCLYKDGKVYGVANAVSKGLIEVETLAEIIPEMHKKDAQPTENEPTKTDIGSFTAKLEKNSYKYTGKAIKPAVTVTGLTDSDFTVSYKNNKKVGTATVTITGTGNYTGTITKTFKITKAANPVKVTAKKTVTANAKKNTTIKKAVTVTKAQGKVTYTTNNKKVTFKNGTMTVANGLKKGKTISVKVTVTAKGNSNYKLKKIVKTIKIKVK